MPEPIDCYRKITHLASGLNAVTIDFRRVDNVNFVSAHIESSTNVMLSPSIFPSFSSGTLVEERDVPRNERKEPFRKAYAPMVFRSTVLGVSGPHWLGLCWLFELFGFPSRLISSERIISTSRSSFLFFTSSNRFDCCSRRGSRVRAYNSSRP